MQVIRAGLFLIVAAGLLSLLACSTTPLEPVVVSPPPADKARLYIYRDATIYGSQVWAAVSLDHTRLGDSAPGVAFYRDVAPGTYEIEVRSDELYPNQFKTVRLAPGSVTFVKIQDASDWGKTDSGPMGTTFVVSIIDPAIGTVETSRLRLIPG
jgi:hypothetical protein